MRLPDDIWVKVHGAETVQDALDLVVEEVLSDHAFFDPQLMTTPEFKTRLSETPIPEGIEEAFKERQLVRFDGLVDRYAQAVYVWYGDNFSELLDLV